MKKLERKWRAIINYTSDIVMFLFIIVFYVSVVYTMIMVCNAPNNLDDFVDLVKEPIMLAIGGYWGRIALTHYQTLKSGNSVPKDIADAIDEDDLEDEGVIGDEKDDLEDEDDVDVDIDDEDV